MPGNDALTELTRKSLLKYLERLSGISSGYWSADCGPAASGGPAEALKPFGDHVEAAVHLGLDALPLAAVMVVDPDELETITKAFTGHAFPRENPRITGADRIMLSELGNILLNAMLNPLVNALKKSSMPSLPTFHEGPAAALAGELGGRLAGELGGRLPGASPLRMLPAVINLECCGSMAVISLFAFLPEDFALEIERA